MTFYMNDYSSEEKYDLSKFLLYEEEIYDVINSPFLSGLNELPVRSYYHVNKGYREIDLIAADAYGDGFYAPLIQFYNHDFRETFPEGTVLNLFSAEDLDTLYYNLSNVDNMSKGDT